MHRFCNHQLAPEDSSLLVGAARDFGARKEMLRSAHERKTHRAFDNGVLNLRAHRETQDHKNPYHKVEGKSRLLVVTLLETTF